MLISSLLQQLFALSTVQKILIMAIPVIFAITIHEAAHGYVARYFGDKTAEQEGRISLNPIKHIDPFGTILVPALTMFAGGILFGWAKPVPVNFSRLNRPKQDMLWVAAAGPFSNLLMAVFWAVIIKVALLLNNQFSTPLALIGAAGIFMNVILFVLNLLPLPPLDGGRIVTSLLPNNLARPYAQLERYGFIILLVLIFTGLLSKIMFPFISLIMGFFAAIVG